jgi:hypothetical protein
MQDASLQGREMSVIKVSWKARWSLSRSLATAQSLAGSVIHRSSRFQDTAARTSSAWSGGTTLELEDDRAWTQQSKFFTAHRVLCSVFNGITPLAASCKIDASTKTGWLVESCRGDERRLRERHFLFLGGWSSLSHSSIPKLKPGRSQPSTEVLSKVESRHYFLVHTNKSTWQQVNPDSLVNAH